MHQHGHRCQPSCLMDILAIDVEIHSFLFVAICTSTSNSPLFWHMSWKIESCRRSRLDWADHIPQSCPCLSIPTHQTKPNQTIK